eukprot:gene795-388_t
MANVWMFRLLAMFLALDAAPTEESYVDDFTSTEWFGAVADPVRRSSQYPNFGPGTAGGAHWSWSQADGIGSLPTLCSHRLAIFPSSYVCDPADRKKDYPYGLEYAETTFNIGPSGRLELGGYITSSTSTPPSRTYTTLGLGLPCLDTWADFLCAGVLAGSLDSVSVGECAPNACQTSPRVQDDVLPSFNSERNLPSKLHPFIFELNFTSGPTQLNFNMRLTVDGEVYDWAADGMPTSEPLASPCVGPLRIQTQYESVHFTSLRWCKEFNCPISPFPTPVPTGLASPAPTAPPTPLASPARTAVTPHPSPRPTSAGSPAPSPAPSPQQSPRPTPFPDTYVPTPVHSFHPTPYVSPRPSPVPLSVAPSPAPTPFKSPFQTPIPSYRPSPVPPTYLASPYLSPRLTPAPSPEPTLLVWPCSESVDDARQCLTCESVRLRRVLDHCARCSEPMTLDPGTHHCIQPERDRLSQLQGAAMALLSGEAGLATLPALLKMSTCDDEIAANWTAPAYCSDLQAISNSSTSSIEDIHSFLLSVGVNYTNSTRELCQPPSHDNGADAEVFRVAFEMFAPAGILEGLASRSIENVLVIYVLFLVLLGFHLSTVFVLTRFSKKRLSPDSFASCAAAVHYPGFLLAPCQLLISFIIFSASVLVMEPSSDYPAERPIGVFIWIVLLAGLVRYAVFLFRDYHHPPNAVPVPYCSADPGHLDIRPFPTFSYCTSHLPALMHAVMGRFPDWVLFKLLPQLHWWDNNDASRKVHLSMRWGFLYQPWRPDCYWFGLVRMMWWVGFNSGLAVTYEFAAAGWPLSIPLGAELALDLVYLSALIFWRPCRSNLMNGVYIIMHIGLAWIFLLATIFLGAHCSHSSFVYHVELMFDVSLNWFGTIVLTLFCAVIPLNAASHLFWMRRIRNLGFTHTLYLHDTRVEIELEETLKDFSQVLLVADGAAAGQGSDLGKYLRSTERELMVSGPTTSLAAVDVLSSAPASPACQIGPAVEPERVAIPCKPAPKQMMEYWGPLPVPSAKIQAEYDVVHSDSPMRPIGKWAVASGILKQILFPPVWLHQKTPRPARLQLTFQHDPDSIVMKELPLLSTASKAMDGPLPPLDGGSSAGQTSTEVSELELPPMENPVLFLCADDQAVLPQDMASMHPAVPTQRSQRDQRQRSSTMELLPMLGSPHRQRSGMIEGSIKLTDPAGSINASSRFLDRRLSTSSTASVQSVVSLAASVASASSDFDGISPKHPSFRWKSSSGPQSPARQNRSFMSAGSSGPTRHTSGNSDSKGSPKLSPEASFIIESHMPGKAPHSVVSAVAADDGAQQLSHPHFIMPAAAGPLKTSTEQPSLPGSGAPTGTPFEVSDVIQDGNAGLQWTTQAGGHHTSRNYTKPSAHGQLLPPLHCTRTDPTHEPQPAVAQPASGAPLTLGRQSSATAGHQAVSATDAYLFHHAILRVAAQQGDVHGFELARRSMIAEGLAPDRDCYVLQAQLFMKIGRSDRAVQVLQHMRTAGLVPPSDLQAMLQL